MLRMDETIKNYKYFNKLVFAKIVFTATPEFSHVPGLTLQEEPQQNTLRPRSPQGGHCGWVRGRARILQYRPHSPSYFVQKRIFNSEIITVHYCTAAGSLLQLDIKTEKLVLTYSTCADTGKVDEVKMPLSIC